LGLALAPACARRGEREPDAAAGPWLAVEPSAAGDRRAFEPAGASGGPALESAGSKGVRALEPSGAVPDDRAAVWLTVAALPGPARASLLDDIGAQVVAAEARKNLLLMNFLEEGPPAAVLASRPWLGPALNAARALTCRRWRVPGAGGWVLALAAGASPAPGAFAAWTPRAAGGEAARLAAWPASFGVLVTFASRADASGGAEALGERLASADSAVGAVLAGAPAAPVRAPFSLSARARRSRHELVALAAHLVDGPPAGPACFWLGPSEAEVYVVPRLGALARHASFVDEVRRALRDARVEARCSYAPAAARRA
jgi:hypothetical protein